MREIKFKYVYQNDNDERIFIKKYDIHEIELEQMGECFIKGHTLIARTQYTGLKDKNGKELYEGDVVKVEVHDNYYEYYTVFYDDDYCGFVLQYGFDGEYETFNGWMSTSTMEVIGNIYENPELLHVKE